MTRHPTQNAKNRLRGLAGNLTSTSRVRRELTTAYAAMM
jgi:hypothetical protein